MIGLKQRFARLLYPYGSTRTVLRGPVRGLRYVVEPGMGATYAMGVDAMNFSFLSGKIEPGMSVYDVGANRGQMALFFSQIVGPHGQVVSFEPVPTVYESLCRNVRLNSLANVRPTCLALLDTTGTAAFGFNAESVTAGRLSGVEPSYADPEADLIEVETNTMDSLLTEDIPLPDVLKVDTEGAAAAVFRGATQLLREVSPAIYVELHGPEEQAGVRDELLAHGYVAETLDGTRVEDPTQGWFSPLWCYKD